VLFSISTKGFYHEGKRKDYEAAGTWPDDAKSVTPDDEVRIRTALKNGDSITEDINNVLVISPLVISMDELKAKKFPVIERNRNDAIVQPVTSSALGAPHIYSAKSENRNFLNNLITLGIDSKFTCTDANGVKARRLHTHAQLLALAHDIEAHISAQFDHYELKLAEIAAASTSAELDAITW
jgi:hypothetical protein